MRLIMARTAPGHLMPCVTNNAPTECIRQRWQLPVLPVHVLNVLILTVLRRTDQFSHERERFTTSIGPLLASKAYDHEDESELYTCTSTAAVSKIEFYIYTAHI